MNCSCWPCMKCIRECFGFVLLLFTALCNWIISPFFSVIAKSKYFWFGFIKLSWKPLHDLLVRVVAFISIVVILKM